MLRVLSTLSFVFGLILANSSMAGEEIRSPTLQNISATHHIKIGYREAPPFSYTTADGHITGYVIDLCNDIINNIATKFHISNIKVDYVLNPSLPVRLQQLNDKSFDLLCTVNTGIPLWKKVIDYSASYAYSYTRFATFKDKHLTTLSQLRGKTVSVTLGSVDSLLLNDVNRQQHLNMHIVATSTMQDAFKMLQDRTAYAVFINEISLRKLIDEQHDNAAYAISSEPVGHRNSMSLCSARMSLN